MPVEYAVLHKACATFDLEAVTTVASFADILDEHSKALATDVDLRTETGNLEPSIWPPLRRAWLKTASAHKTSDDQDDEGRVQLRKLCLSLARFTRNLVAAIPLNQERAFENEPAIRDLSHYYTAYSMIQDAESSFPVTRMLAQTLSNLVTANEGLMSRLWNSYLNLPEEQLVLVRFFAVPDARTIMSTFVLMLNCLDSSRSRRRLLTSSQSGLRLCISFLDRTASLFEDEESAESGQAFEVAYHVFCRMVENGMIPALYERIAVQGEVVTPHQTTLLKLLDSYLQPEQKHNLQLDQATSAGLSAMLVTEFFALSEYAQQAINRALGSNSTNTPQTDSKIPSQGTAQPPGHPPENSTMEYSPLHELDLLLPKVSEALVVVTQCLISLALFSEESMSRSTQIAADIATANTQVDGNLIDYVNGSVSPSGKGSIECLIETLRVLDRFLPRITFGKVAPSPALVAEPGGRPRPQTMEMTTPGGQAGDISASDPKGFAYLKRDLVRLLGILSSGCRAVQDRVRACGGIPVVLNLCVVDDRNPYLREHAIFTLRNLLYGNLESQALVNEIQPLRGWDEDGVLQARSRVE